MRVFLFAAIFSAVSFGQYKAEPAGPPPSEVAPSIGAALQKDGTKITNNGKPYLEIWFLASNPPAGKPDEGQTLSVAQGALLGVIRFDSKGQDRRGQGIQPGVYTLRYSLIPVNGDHQGVAPQRDFAVLVRASDDTDPKATPAFDALVALSAKASGTPHPAVLSIWGSAADKFPNFSKQNEHDWVLDLKVGDLPLSIILAGKVEG